MDYVELECPSCSAPLSAIEKAGRITCEYCGSVIMVRHRELNDGGTLTVIDPASQTEVAYVRVPFGWELSGRVDNAIQSYQYPFTILVDAVNKETSTVIHYQSGAGFSDQTGSNLFQQIRDDKLDPESKVRQRRFIGIGNYLDSYVAGIYSFEKDGIAYKVAAATVLEGVKWHMTTPLAGLFGKKQDERIAQLARPKESSILEGIGIDAQPAAAVPAQGGGGSQQPGGSGGILGGLFGGSGGASGGGSLFDKTYLGKKMKSGEFDQWMDKAKGSAFGDTLGNLMGSLQGSSGNTKENTAVETAEEASFAQRGGLKGLGTFIDWESRHTFLLQTPAAVFEHEYDTAFIDFCSTLRLNRSFEQRRYQIQDQILEEIRRRGAERQAASNAQFAAWQQQHAAQTAAFDSYNKA